MRKAIGAAGAIAAVLLAFACSSSSPSHPPVEGCQGTGCVGGSGGGGSSGSGGSSSGSSGGTGDDASSGPCGLPSSSSQCLLYLGRQCCTLLQGCTGDATCENLLACVNACGGGATCVNTCEQSFPRAANTYEMLDTCARTAGSPCTESGTGDPCGSLAYPCTSNLSCNGTWCTRPCSSDADCTGIGPNGGNELGFPNACIRLSGGATTCAPGCQRAQDCNTIFPGTTCVLGNDASGSTAFVCGYIGDAAAE